MGMRKPQFSLQHMCWFLAALGAGLAVNLWPRVDVERILFFGRGEREFVILERGWPFRYLQYREPVALDAGSSAIAQGWPRGKAIPWCSHVHWLLADILIAAGGIAVTTWGMGRIVRPRTAGTDRRGLECSPAARCRW